jgi:hypothetical protein
MDPETSKPKVFFHIEVIFRLHKFGQGVIQEQNPDSRRSSAKHSKRITMEKVFGDFKRLHDHIIETFQNEL